MLLPIYRPVTFRSRLCQRGAANIGTAQRVTGDWELETFGRGYAALE